MYCDGDVPGRFYTDSVDLLFENNIKKMIKSNQFDFAGPYVT